MYTLTLGTDEQLFFLISYLCVHRSDMSAESQIMDQSIFKAPFKDALIDMVG